MSLGLALFPDEMNRHLRTAVIAPMTTATPFYPTRVRLRFEGKAGEAALDQIRAADRSRLVKATAGSISAVVVEMFTWG